jgi:hypothetical protein
LGLSIAPFVRSCSVVLAIGRDRVIRVGGDQGDPFDQGFLCPKGSALAAQHRDPDPAAATSVSKRGTRGSPLRVAIETSDSMMPGRVCLPHGWSHDVSGIRIEGATSRAGVESKLLTFNRELDRIRGNAISSGIPVEVFAAK